MRIALNEDPRGRDAWRMTHDASTIKSIEVGDLSLDPQGMIIIE